MDAVGELGIRLPRPFRVVAREHPAALAVGNERGLEVCGAHRAQIVDGVRKLERALHVLLGGLVVALDEPAASPPGEDARLERVAGQTRALGKRECLVEQAECGLDAVELDAAAAEPEQDICTLDVGEGLGLGDRARLVEEHERGAMVADAHLREPAPDERAYLQLRNPGCAGSRGERLERVRRLFVLLRLVQRLGAREGSLEPGTLVGGDAAREEAGVDPETLGEPLDRALRRAGLAALDLGDVLLREAVARQLALRQPGGDAKLAEPFPEAKAFGAGSAGAADGVSHGHVSARLVKRILH